MPRKNKEEYNQYMRNYMKNKYKKETNKPPMDGDFDGTNKPTLDLQGDATKELMNLGKEIFKDPETGKPDKILTYIERGAKYLPLVMKFAEGFMSNMHAFKQENSQQQEAKMQAPEGWESISPLEKMKYKYSRPAWYEAGLRWDQYKETGQINSQINTGYVDPSYSQPRRGQPIQHDQQVNSLADLSRKHAEPPLINDQNTSRVVEGDPQSYHDPKLEAVIKEKQNRNKKPEEIEKEKTNEEKPMDENPQTDEIIDALKQDNLRYIQMAIKFVGSMSMEEFKKKINSLDSVVKKFEFMFALIPVHLREMIKKTPDSEMIAIFKESCADKYKWCEENNHLPKISKMFNSIKSKI